MISSDRSDFDSDMWRLYDFICRYFLGTISRDLKYNSTTSKIRIGTEYFSNTSNVLIDPGYSKIMTWQVIMITFN